MSPEPSSSSPSGMRKLFTLSLLALLLVAATGVPTLSAEDVAESELMQAATELGRQYDANYNDKKPAAMAALYTSDGVLLSPVRPDRARPRSAHDLLCSALRLRG